jgi:hypothetical protein
MTQKSSNQGIGNESKLDRSVFCAPKVDEAIGFQNLSLWSPMGRARSISMRHP